MSRSLRPPFNASPLRLAPVACAFAALASSPLHAADEPVVQLPSVEINAVREPSLTAPSLAAARADLALTPGGTEVVDADRYLTGRASTLADTFFLSPGVFAQPRFGSDEARLSIRGSGLQRTFHGRGIRVLQDGAPINLADGGFDMQSLEPTATSHINVWRGGNALAHGSSTLGGAIDYVSRNGRNSPGGFGRLEVGSWNYLRATLAGGAAFDSTDAYASFTQHQQESFRDHAEQNNRRFFANAGLRLSDSVETRFYLTAIKTDSELPGSLTKAQLEANPRQANASNLNRDQKRDFELLRVANKTSLKTGDTTIDLTAAWTYKDLFHPINNIVDQVSNDLITGITLTNTTDLFDHENRLRAGVLVSRGDTNAKTFQYAAPTGQTRGLLATDNEQTATNFEAFVDNQLNLGAGFTGIAGASFAYDIRKNQNRFTKATTAPALGYSSVVPPAFRTYEEEYANISPKLGLLWDNPARDVQVFANISGSFEPPSFSETITANTARDAQTATTFELGTRGARRFLRWDLTAYHAAIKDELLTVVDPVTTLSTTTNADRTTHTGLELSTEIDLLGQDWKTDADHRLVLRTAWTYGRFKFDRHSVGLVNYSGNTIAGLPAHLIRGELLWENASGWYAGPTFEWVPVKSYVDHRNTFSSDPYALLGFKFGRRLAKGVSWFVEARNLTDETYAATTGVIDNAAGADTAQFLPGDGRSLFAGLEYRF